MKLIQKLQYKLTVALATGAIALSYVPRVNAAGGGETPGPYGYIPEDTGIAGMDIFVFGGIVLYAAGLITLSYVMFFKNKIASQDS